MDTAAVKYALGGNEFNGTRGFKAGDAVSDIANQNQDSQSNDATFQGGTPASKATAGKAGGCDQKRENTCSMQHWLNKTPKQEPWSAVARLAAEGVTKPKEEPNMDLDIEIWGERRARL
jgi:hypothetical protein